MLVVVLLVPTAVLYALGTECMAGWLRVWTPCQDVSNFNVNITGGVHKPAARYLLITALACVFHVFELLACGFLRRLGVFVIEVMH